jgi:DNA modification methylase
MISLIMGDCLQEMKQMKDNYVDIIVTSPPI